MKRKNLVVIALFLLALVVTGFTYAYWAGAVQGATATEAANKVNIGEGRPVVTTVSVTDANDFANNVLVPKDREEASVVPAGKTVVEEVTFTFAVSWVETQVNSKLSGAAATRKLSAVVNNIKINGETTHAGLVVTTVTGDNFDIVLNGAAVTVTVKVTLTEPGTQEIYNAIINKEITFDLVLTIPEAV